AFRTRSSPRSPSSSMPGVSTITTGPRGSSSMALRTGSVVVPLTSETTARSWPVTRFTRLDFPTFLLPKKPICSRSPEGVSFIPIILSPLPIAQMLQETLQTFHNIIIGSLDIPGIPGIRNIPGVMAEIQQQMKFMLRIPPDNGHHVPQIPGIHADEVVVFPVILRAHAHRPFLGAGNSQLRQLFPGAPMNRIADFLGAGSGGRNIKIIGGAPSADHVL